MARSGQRRFLTNRSLMREINNSKKTFCSFIDDAYGDYDIIVPSLESIKKNAVIQQGMLSRLDRLNRIRSDAGEEELEITDINPGDVVFRIMTDEHIPDYDPNDTTVRRKRKTSKMRVNFPPFKHYILSKFKASKNNKKFSDITIKEVCRSHWVGSFSNGHFNMTHGKLTRHLSDMFMLLVTKYATSRNWSGYCITSDDEALTKRGWLNIDQINEEDMILSYLDGTLKWSKIKSIFRDDYDGLMHKITTQHGIDMLVTPGHKLVTERGLIKIEHLLESDRVILTGKSVDNGIQEPIYSDAFVELMGWILTDGGYGLNQDKTKMHKITIYQNEGSNSQRIRTCLNALNYTYSESKTKNISFYICHADSKKIFEIFPEKNLSMKFIMDLTPNQREILIDTMLSGDGWRTGVNKQHRRYSQKDKNHMDLFQALCAMTGYRSNVHASNTVSFGKKTSIYTMNMFGPRKNFSRVEVLNFHGGKRNNRNGAIGKGKESHPNVPTTPYKGRVWCPETEFGSFMARRNGTVYLTGNSYVDEMKSQALTQLIMFGLQFDESKSSIPFGYYTILMKNSFRRILHIEKKNQAIRDELMMDLGYNPSFSKQNEDGNVSDDNYNGVD